MRAFLVAVTWICVLFVGTRCSAQTAEPQSESINTQSAAIHAARIGDSCVFEGSEIESYPKCVLRDDQGKLFIARDYVKKLKFDRGPAAVWHDDQSRHGWMYVDRKGRVIIQGVPSSDNWADAFSDGLVRTVINEKYGFADRHGKLIIAPKYDGAFPFEHGYTVVCIGCRETCAMTDHPRADCNVDCEHYILTGGEWFKINKTGRVVARSVPH
jgi:hypothetical protein